MRSKTSQAAHFWVLCVGERRRLSAKYGALKSQPSELKRKAPGAQNPEHMGYM
ncbi:hypothetical protein P3W43_07920 [Salinicola salarius]|uniref:hypothetical protein n=1 Tax=Salinicola salarius TaxID=430457 RepID=UPI0023E374F5|nr:hypothetical protein [Salinicola salarius]MDF3918782.1 hypothetical protein [Salinicola salarius]